MSDKTIFITGAAAGIGAETARLFARNGWRVGASDVNATALESLRQELGDDRVVCQAADVRDRAGVERAIANFVETSGGRLDAVFANAGVLFMGPHESIGAAQKDLLVDVNVRGVVNTFDAAYPWLRRNPGSHAVAMASTSAEYGTPQHAVYSATKFFVRGLTEALNIEWAPQGINVSAIYVAYVDTPMVRDAEVKPASIEAMGVKVTPQQVAEAVWRAVHGQRSHWRVGTDAKAVNALVRLLGSASAPVLKRILKV
jgi:NADP-dependent 3-hydroxy acid dehydrogenase YdfG